MKAFLCHSSHDSAFVLEFAGYIKKHLSVFYYEEYQRSDESFNVTIHNNLRDSQVFVIFVGIDYSQDGVSHQADWQVREVGYIENRKANDRRVHVFVVPLLGAKLIRNEITINELQINTPFIDFLSSCYNLNSHYLHSVCVYESECKPNAEKCAQEILRKLGILWIGGGDLPIDPHLFSYEKDIIEFYRKKHELGEELFEKSDREDEENLRVEMRRKLSDGCPAEWPTVIDLTIGRSRDQIRDNPLTPDGISSIGNFRNRSIAKVAAAALVGQGTREAGLFFPEAGPRRELAFPTDRGRQLGVGIVVSGGIAPGINAVIDGIVQRHSLYATHDHHNVSILGYRNGFHALKGPAPPHYRLKPYGQAGISEIVTSEHANEGGSVLGTFRWEKLLHADLRTRIDNLNLIIDRLEHQAIDILYVIGGDGSMKAAHAISHLARERAGGEHVPLSVVAIPKTMDNDILWMWQSFGFLSAVEKAREIVEQLDTEVRSNPRICVLQVFGSDSGFVVSHAVLASAAGQCDLAIIPEIKFSILGIAHYLKGRIWSEGDRLIPRALVVMGETAIPMDASWYIPINQPNENQRPKFPALPSALSDNDKIAIERARERLFDPTSSLYSSSSRPRPPDITPDEIEAIRKFDRMRGEGKRIEGQTSDELRRAGVKIVLRGLDALLPQVNLQVLPNSIQPDWHNALRLFANEPRHLVRAIPPSTSDIVMGQRLGILAVDNAMAGFTDFMISQWLTEFVLVPLKLVVLGRKRIPRSGIFWKQVLAKTGQPDDLVSPWPLR